MLFIAIVSAFFVTKHAVHVDALNHLVNPWHHIDIPSVLWLNTGVLIISSITIEVSRRGIFNEIKLLEEWFGPGRPVRKRVLIWLSVSIMLGVVFLWEQYLAWKRVSQQRDFFEGNPSVRGHKIHPGWSAERRNRITVISSPQCGHVQLAFRRLFRLD